MVVAVAGSQMRIEESSFEDGFAGRRDGGLLAEDETLYGGRFELVVKF